jgi:hypothetical protein
MTKLYLINNGLKDLRGHYFETSVAVAEAARAQGLEPILAAHRSCPTDLVPGWLPFHPVFSTDHWMTELTPRLRNLVRSLVPMAWHEPLRRWAERPRIWGSALVGRRAARVVSRESASLARELEQIGVSREIQYLSSFREELHGLLAQTGCVHRDHVFLPTAHGRELAAVQELVLSLPEGLVPTFHLEFRHDFRNHRSTYGDRHRVYFEHTRARPGWDRLRLYADTAELAGDLERFSGLAFGTLPIPFRANLLQQRSGDPNCLCIVSLGEARDEKGFHWLPHLVDALMEDYVRQRRVRFVFQASLDEDAYAPRSRIALERLRQYDPACVRLVGTERPLDPVAYYRIVSDGDILVCPFDADRYRLRSSGTLTEAIAAGIATVVPENTWLARHQPPDSGEVFTTRDSFVGAVKRICDAFPHYLAGARAARENWLSYHSPRNLVAQLIEPVEGRISCGSW